MQNNGNKTLSEPIHKGDIVTTVDLFAGCGGLSLGFELYRNGVRFETVLALDNSPQAVRCYNVNEPSVKGRSPSDYPTARIFDMTWFSHPGEVLLYYLLHLSCWRKDSALAHDLDRLRVPDFLAHLHYLDEQADSELARLAADPEYGAAISKIDRRLFAMAIFDTFMNKLGLASLKVPSVSNHIPWAEEANKTQPSVCSEFPQHSIPEVQAGLEKWIADELGKLKESALKTGHGQNAVVSQRLKDLVSFLSCEQGSRLIRIWLAWRATRDTVRANFVTKVAQHLPGLYQGDRCVRLVLGGPPCKGFSRIGRAVIVSLRDQGAHAWASHEFGDERNALLYKYVLFLEALQPEAFLFENVAHFGSALKTPKGLLDASNMLQEAICTLSSSRLHYLVSPAIVRAREFAIPQDRARFIMFGVRSDKGDQAMADSFFEIPRYDETVPLITALQGLAPAAEFRDNAGPSIETSHKSDVFTFFDPRMPTAYQRFISWIRQPAANQNQAPATVDAHIYRRMRPDDAAILTKFAPGQRWMDYKIRSSETIEQLKSVLLKLAQFQKQNATKDLPSADEIKSMLSRINEGLCLRLLLEELSGTSDTLMFEPNHLLSDAYLQKGHDAHGDWFERLDATRPCKTVVAHIGKDTYGYFHPFEQRAITIREAARVQSFPDFFQFGSVGVVDGYSIIGNAVPPLLAHAFAVRISELVFKRSSTRFKQHTRKNLIQPRLIET